ncbi:putative protein phosphatase 2C 8 [Panicum miliaceum]|uniref:protein-serine/threonine phosphatase n=1 Tax=Panicum miliaceum TaxID=4540 RepID=A0A3L6SHS8_PANMI|nr:putative protein phosphatase 2C 8 [Panicum miliaceum]
MSGGSDVPGAARLPEPMALAWGGTAPALYLSYGMVSLRGRRPALTDAVAAARSFTALSPPLGLDYFAVLDGGHLGAAPAIAERIEASCAARRSGSAGRRRATAVIREALRAVNGEVVASGGATALVALVLEKYIVVANCGAGAAKAVLSRGGEHGAQYRPPATAEADVVAVERGARDDFLILASDGLWDVVTSASACGLVRRRLVTTPRVARPREPPLDARGSPTVLAKELAEQAVRAGSQDNVSVVVLVLFRDFWLCGRARRGILAWWTIELAGIDVEIAISAS